MNVPHSQWPAMFALRTTTAALFAFAAAWDFGIHHPWWAAMTVWLVAQPTQGLLFERSLARLIGTICGALTGALILNLLAENRLDALVAVAAWLALCAGLGSIFRHFLNYGFVLAGYTASIIVLFGIGERVSDPGLTLDRVICTMIGIICSAVFSYHALPGRGKVLAHRRADVVDRCLAYVEEFLRKGTIGKPCVTLLSEIATLDRCVDEYAAGSLHRQREARRTRCISGLLLELIALSATSHGGNLPQETQGSTKRHLAMLIAAANNSRQPAMADTLDELRQILVNERTSPEPLQLDIDPSSVWRAASRPVVALAIAAIIWWVSGWGTGAMMVMTAALFTSLFSSHDHGNHMVIQVLLGTMAGAITGVLARLFLLPHADGLAPTLLCIAPFLLAGAWLMQRPATSKMAIDLTMTFLLTSQPSSPPVGVELAFNEAAAMIVGVMIAVATFWTLLPATPAVYSSLLAKRIVRLTLQLSTNRGTASAKAMRQSLRSAVARLLCFTKPQDAIFLAAQECLATANQVLATKIGDQTPSTSSPNASACDSAARQAAAMLADALTKNQNGETS
ncbi:FUSC family protein [Acerihabitans sp. TG2]|uniref:FUSC family protein n=1 Tax=Acerihabitans sp. TG2 TaxID=3096008 RepID=UPI002B23584E|nr:FUSC family protein [Acerihabitans sp. TG2]MEA9391560.1 FUSC family protein [Acerihabitans sp. TG2]